MRFVTPPTSTPALARIEKPIAQSLDDIKLRIMRLEQTVEDHARVTTATLYKAQELWKPTWMPVEADGLHYWIADNFGPMAAGASVIAGLPIAICGFVWLCSH